MPDDNTSDDIKWPHGTLTGYTTYYCRCEPCKASASQYQRNWYLANGPYRVRKVPRGKHGLVSTYTRCHCRCKRCVKAKHEQYLRYRAKKEQNAQNLH